MNVAYPVNTVLNKEHRGTILLYNCVEPRSMIMASETMWTSLQKLGNPLPPLVYTVLGSGFFFKGLWKVLRDESTPPEKRLRALPNFQEDNGAFARIAYRSQAPKRELKINKVLESSKGSETSLPTQ